MTFTFHFSFRIWNSASIFDGFCWFWFCGSRCLFRWGECDQVLCAHLSETENNDNNTGDRGGLTLVLWKEAPPGLAWTPCLGLASEAFQNYPTGDKLVMRAVFSSVSWVCYPGQNRAVVNLLSRLFSVFGPVQADVKINFEISDTYTSYASSLIIVFKPTGIFSSKALNDCSLIESSFRMPIPICWET